MIDWNFIWQLVQANFTISGIVMGAAVIGIVIVKIGLFIYRRVRK